MIVMAPFSVVLERVADGEALGVDSSISKTPMGPFQMTVLQARLRGSSSRGRAVARPIQTRGTRPGRTWVLALRVEGVGDEDLVREDELAPFSSASFMAQVAVWKRRRRGCRRPCSLGLEEGEGHAAADDDLGRTS